MRNYVDGTCDSIKYCHKILTEFFSECYPPFGGNEAIKFTFSWFHENTKKRTVCFFEDENSYFHSNNYHPTTFPLHSSLEMEN